MPRFFVNKDAISDGFITITGEDAFHIARALRMAVGDAITVSDGGGVDFACELTRIRDSECECRVLSSSVSALEPPVAVTLYMAYPKGDKLEMVVQKAVELGAVRVVPFESSRCIKKPNAEKTDKKTERLSRIAREAAGQCGRARLTEVLPPHTFQEMIESAKKAELALVCYENEDGLTIKDALTENAGVKSIALVVGSEGGFSADEIARCLSAGIKSVSLGKRILRCETAPLFALSAISYGLEL